VTLQIIEPDGTVDNIGQTTSVEAGNFTITFTASNVMDGNYIAKIGGEGVTVLYEKSFVLPTGPIVIPGTIVINKIATAVLEAEAATSNTNAKVMLNDETVGGSSMTSETAGPPITLNFLVNVETAGTYTVTYRYYCNPAGVYFKTSSNNVKLVDGGAAPSLTFIDQEFTATLSAGPQTLSFFISPGAGSSVAIDKITIK
jgi:hypothetical protein